MKRQPFIAGNWKMNKTGQQAVETATQLARLCSDIKDIEVMIAPANLSLALVAQAIQGTTVKLGAQNLYFEQQGAFTGEVSADMVKAAGAEYILVGHSERRQYFGETDEAVNRKIAAALGVGLKPVLCIGETLAQRKQENTYLILDKQVSDGLKGFGLEELSNLVLAYEPVWAIGTGQTAGIEQVEAVHQHLRSLLESLFSKDLADRTRIVYGGSVKPENVKKIMTIEDVDGALVGGASLDADKFINIIKYNG